VRKADNLPPSCAVVTKSGNLNFLEPSGPLRACNGTALPFTIYLFTYTPISITWGHYQFKLLFFLAVTPVNYHVTWREEYIASVRMRSLLTFQSLTLKMKYSMFPSSRKKVFYNVRMSTE
jgi:hypothetical protein